MEKHIYPYSSEKYLIESFNDYLYAILGYTNTELYNMKAFISRDYRIYSLNLLKSVNPEYIKFFLQNFRLIINDIDLNYLKIYQDDYYSYITLNNINQGNKSNILSSSYIPTKYLFNFAKKEYLCNLDKELKNLYKPDIDTTIELRKTDDIVTNEVYFKKI